MLFKRIFSRGTGETVRSIRISKVMDEALSKLSDQAGESTNRYIVWALDLHLQQQAKAGLIPFPYGHEGDGDGEKAKVKPKSK